DNGEWMNAGTTASLGVDLPGVYAGTYVAQVRARNALGVFSQVALSAPTTLQGKTTPPPVVTSLTAAPQVFAIGLHWTFPAGPLDVERTELWYGQTANRADAIKLGDFAYPQNTHTLLGAPLGKTVWFWARLVDKSGNVGDWYPTGNGIPGAASSNPDEIVAVMGKIGPERLTPALLNQLDASDRLDGLRDEMTQLAEAQRDAILDAEHTGGTARSAQSGVAVALQQISQQADELHAEAKARLLLQALLHDVQAGLLVEQSVQADDIEAISTSLTTLISHVAANDAAIIQEATTRTTHESAQASTLQQVQTKVGDLSASITQLAQSLDGLDATYILKVTANGKIAGMKLQANQQGAAIDFLCDAFRISLPDGSSSTAVFVVTSVNGQPAVGINGGLIVTGSIAADALSVQRLSAISANIGIVTAGLLRNSANTSFINLDAVKGAPFLSAGNGNVVLYEDGRAYFNNVVISRPMQVASGTWNGSLVAWAWHSAQNQGDTSYALTGPYSMLIDTGYEDPDAMYGLPPNFSLVAAAVANKGTHSPALDLQYRIAISPTLVYAPLLYTTTGVQGNASGRVYINVAVQVLNITGATPAQITNIVVNTINWKLYKVT
ncbi:hypothetical protein, partial [Andreprevotia chitinilytica]|uniref:hypothetical protein n=1 Tax=Andreprevotia chitinilytica TaxID=396808 RepID=UPI001B808570